MFIYEFVLALNIQSEYSQTYMFDVTSEGDFTIVIALQ